MSYMGRKMYSNSLYYIKAQNKYMAYKKQREVVRINSEFTWSRIFHVPKGP